MQPYLWFGGKAAYFQDILSHYPPHTTLIDACGGSGCILFNSMRRKTSKIYVYNDIGYSAKFMRNLRDNTPELLEKLRYTVYGRDELAYAKENWKNTKDPVLQSALWYVLVQQSFEHSEKGNGWRPSIGNDESEDYRNYVERLPIFAEMLRHATIENLDAVDLMHNYDESPSAKDILWYLDPPYETATRVSTNVYTYEMTDNHHWNLLRAANQVRGSVIMSGYESDLYDAMLRPSDGWVKYRYEHLNKANHSSIGTKTEIVYVKSNQKGLWEIG